MAKKNRIIIESNFPAAKKVGWETVQEARELWKHTGSQSAEEKVMKDSATRGYALQVGVGSENVGHQSARFFPVTFSSRWGSDPWFLRFFEYGTVFIKAMPFVRPAARKADKAFVAAMGNRLEGTIRRRASVRKRG